MKSIAERIEKDGDRRCLGELLLRQQIIQGNDEVANKISTVCQIDELPAGSVLIRQGNADNDIYFILCGNVRVLVNEREIATRGAGQHVGEMALVDCASKRTATVITSEQSTFARVSAPAFHEIANAHPFLWKNIAVELVQRLDQRRKFHASPNILPVLFIGSSRESLPTSKAFQSLIPEDVATARLWSEGVFGPSHFPIEDLTTILKCSDYAAIFVTADDKVSCRGEDSFAPRDNILFELGLFMGAISRHRTFIVIPRGMDIKIPTDLLGITPVTYENGSPIPPGGLEAAALEIINNIKENGSK